MQNPMVKILGDCEEVPLRHGLVGLYIHFLASVVGLWWGEGRVLAQARGFIHPWVPKLQTLLMHPLEAISLCKHSTYVLDSSVFSFKESHFLNEISILNNNIHEVQFR